MRGVPSIAERFRPDEIAHYRSLGFWGDEVLSDFLDRAAEAHPDSLCVADPDRSYTYAEAQDKAYRLAAGMAALGLQAGDAIVVQIPNLADAVITYYAIARLGAIFVPRMPIYREHEVRDAVERTEAKALFVADTFRRFDHGAMAMNLKKECDCLEHVVVRGDLPEGAIDFNELLTAEPYEGAKPQADDIHTILFTSGTTAQPKGVVHSWNTYVAAAKGLVNNFRLTPEDRCLMPSPIMHNTGMLAGVVAPLVAGCGTVVQPIWEAEEGLELIARFSVTYSVGATPFVTMLMDAYDPARHDVSSLRLFACGGAPVPGSIVRQAVEVLGCTLQTVFGQGESSLQTLTDLADPVDRVASSDGKAVAGTEVYIFDEDGVEVPRSTEGEICSKGPAVMLGYWRDPERTTESFTSDGYFRSGDLGWMDDDGYIRVTGRKKDIIIRGGTNISPSEIEGMILELPVVTDVAVVAMPDRILGERACAFVVLADGATLSLDDVTSFLKERKIAMQKLPERLEIRAELPHNITGKVEKYKLRAEIEEILTRQAER